MKTSLSILIYLVLSFSVTQVSAQLRIVGRITDAVTKKPVPFTTIGIKNKSIGTVSEEDGRFAFTVPIDSINQKEKLIISSIGYADSQVYIDEFKRGFVEIKLSPKIISIPQVTVKPEKFKTKTFGRTAQSAFMNAKMISESDHISDDLGKEIGTVIKIDNNCSLTNFNMFVISSHFKNIKFRLNIYSVKNNLPDSLLINDNIIFDVAKQRMAWINVDLKKYNIRFENRNKIAVVIQWLKSEISEDDSKKSFNVAATHSFTDFILFRDKSQATWLKVGGNMSFNITGDCFKP